ncbi:hypothetical protein [Citrobacter rodentium]|jgi:hypothetical protein|uniref:Membrane protein n=2 Tax=Citrobacter rodentium TaxID=67825 RepID=D2TRH4_CITRI|nr:hypothetical protein [Citrobacter rodentium]KIQ50464.1 hypothetical protein TA05_15475 [Citrobacter rodentium]QBY28786.1 hypothetical protein E2R62_07915 [Citrobacter rodentium]UHO29349.1 hypothetical protein K7R23_14965 [Citrobacter rodentium NBRC 105723 = DSM 16636]CBG89021.1 putative membrane protein [Citrobacter rodentium ICC168]HAT8011620.1 hypothetical protein [Citrobacter rodentium NBRC 105723 = DSM 16636]
MENKIILFAIAIWSAGLWFIFDTWQEWKKGKTHIRSLHFFSRRRWDAVYRSDEPIVFLLILSGRLALILLMMVSVLWYTIRWYLYERI